MATVDLNRFAQCFRFIFIALNIVFLLIGLALTALSIYLLVTQQDYIFLTGDSFASGAALILVAGIVTVVISLLGILGSVVLWSSLLIIYAFLVALVVVLQVAAGIVGFIYREEVEDQVSDNAIEAINDYNGRSSQDATEAIDFIQNEFDCCGWNSRNDWIDTNYFVNISTGAFPESCECGNRTDDDCEFVFLTNQNIWTESCNDSVIDFLREYQQIIGGVGIAFGVAEITLVVLAILLACCIQYSKNKYTTV